MRVRPARRGPDRLAAAVPLLVALMGPLAPVIAGAQEGGSATPPTAPATAPAASATGPADLAKQLANPIASLVSVPFQLNWDGPIGPEDQTRFLVNFQPVMPFAVSPEWNVIARVIVPMVSQPVLVPGGTAESGFSDILTSLFFSPSKPGALIWGIGPVFQLPTTADPSLGTAKWSAGPTAIVLKQAGPWTTGALANHVWSFAGDDDRADVNQTFLQPFLSYTTPTSWTFGLNTEASANWEAASGQEWTVPLIGQVSRVVHIGRRPASLGVAVADYLESPDGGPSWKFRMNLTLLYPR